jgi:hypothetical protein
VVLRSPVHLDLVDKGSFPDKSDIAHECHSISVGVVNNLPWIFRHGLCCCVGDSSDCHLPPGGGLRRLSFRGHLQVPISLLPLLRVLTLASIAMMMMMMGLCLVQVSDTGEEVKLVYSHHRGGVRRPPRHSGDWPDPKSRQGRIRCAYAWKSGSRDCNCAFFAVDY